MATEFSGMSDTVREEFEQLYLNHWEPRSVIATAWGPVNSGQRYAGNRREIQFSLGPIDVINQAGETVESVRATTITYRMSRMKFRGGDRYFYMQAGDEATFASLVNLIDALMQCDGRGLYGLDGLPIDAVDLAIQVDAWTGCNHESLVDALVARLRKRDSVLQDWHGWTIPMSRNMLRWFDAELRVIADFMEENGYSRCQQIRSSLNWNSPFQLGFYDHSNTVRIPEDARPFVLEIIESMSKKDEYKAWADAIRHQWTN